MNIEREQEAIHRRWHFNTMRPSDKKREAIQGEYFADQAIDEPGEALVREGGHRNSLDGEQGLKKDLARYRLRGASLGLWC